MAKSSQGYGQIQLFTGDGKGKTSAALGEVLRSVGAGKKVAVIFFDKGGDRYSERKVMERLLAADVDYYAFGRDRRLENGSFDFSINEEDTREARNGLDKAVEIIENNEHDLLVLDEINTTAALGMVNTEEVHEILDNKPKNLEIIMTGRNAALSFIERADLVTDMRCIKHYMEKGVKAREGLDY